MNHFIVLITAAVFAASFVGGSHAKNAKVGVQPRMVGGTDAREGQFPYHIALRGAIFCSGSIIDREWVLTAAHCLDKESSQTLTVVAGTPQLRHGGQKFVIRKIVLHPSYSPETIENDIALIQVTKPFVYTDRIRPIELNTGDVPVGAKLTFSGWGSDFNVLQYINMVKISTEKCKQTFVNTEVINKNHICAYNGLDQCSSKGDSGGPLVYNGRLSGILSRQGSGTFGCVTITTKVSAYINWIKQHIH